MISAEEVTATQYRSPEEYKDFQCEKQGYCDFVRNEEEALLYQAENLGVTYVFKHKESAIGYARSAKRLVRETVSKLGVDSIHLFFAGPLGVAIFFGQLLNSMPEVQCYEQRQDGGYQLSCLIPRT